MPTLDLNIIVRIDPSGRITKDCSDALRAKIHETMHEASEAVMASALQGIYKPGAGLKIELNVMLTAPVVLAE